jgi:hypothetical protein
MESPQAVEKGSLLAQDPGRQQIRLGVKSRGLQPAVLAFAYHPLRDRSLSIVEQVPLKASTNSSMCCLRTPFMRMNYRSVYMYV